MLTLENLGNDMSYALSFMVTKFKEKGVWYLYNWLNEENVSIEDERHPLYIALEEKTNRIKYFDVNGSMEDFSFLRDAHFLVRDDKEVREIVEKKFAEINDPSDVGIVLMPVNQACNFRCIYCHQDHGASERMGEREKETILRFIKKLNPLKLRVDYFGGEPLLNSGFMIDFNETLKLISKDAPFYLSSSSVTTNGYLLTKSLFVELLKAKITTFQITIDGPRRFHDKLRPLATGEGTFDTIYGNLMDISSLDRSHKFSVTIRMNFYGESSKAEYLKEFIDKLTSDFGDDERFVFMAQQISNWSNDTLNKNIYLEEKDGTRRQIKIEQKIEKAGMNSVSMVNLTGPESSHCYSSKPNFFVLYPYPDKNAKSLLVQKCTLCVSNPINNVGWIRSDGSLEANTNIDIWTKGSLFDEKKCRSCFFVLSCFGKSCGLRNYEKGKIVCPKEKQQEVMLVKRILGFIERDVIKRSINLEHKS
uniref:Sulfatase maturation enzyme AslB, radical SAM superfamily n=1 Tax=Candidatus Kentrum sp. DK TaxID=2126562 RepID=A0A450T9K2_9GAMM|nr:MAG: Sulfatase maturation enzyme AslB, radical SAM superfamily [Candidatus Kentron sp. DK]